LIHERFGDYTLVALLGAGGMASVYEATRRGDTFALKRPRTALLNDGEFVERFLREAEIGRTLHHPNIVRIFEQGHVDRVPYFTMELLQGETLQARTRRAGAVAPRAAAEIACHVAEALDYAHLKGVVHRDLKPSNIMMVDHGRAKVMDYGIARAARFDGLTLAGSFMGTAEYASPETAEGRPADPRSDLYSLGVILFELLTGHRPFVADTPLAVLRKHCTEEPASPRLLAPQVPPELEAIVLRLLGKDPAQRHPTAESLLRDLRDYLTRAA
jgi:serine/threonine-protein kinase